MQLKYFIPAIGNDIIRNTSKALTTTGSEEKENIARIGEILTTADLSKFAKYIPPEEVSGKMVDMARTL
ncbi:MAG: hypothetical protein R2727_06880 [Bacteroidales bacterium]